MSTTSTTIPSATSFVEEAFSDLKLSYIAKSFLADAVLSYASLIEARANGTSNGVPVDFNEGWGNGYGWAKVDAAITVDREVLRVEAEYNAVTLDKKVQQVAKAYAEAKLAAEAVAK